MECDVNIALAGLAETRQMPELGRLKAIAERIMIASQKVEGFVEKFHGPYPCEESGPADKSADNYRNDLSTVFHQIERLESAVSQLDTIG